MRKSSKPGKKPAKKALVLASSTGVEVGGKGELSGKVKTRPETSPQRPQPGGGYLQTGNPGNKGGGRTPNEIRGSLRKIIEDKGLPWLERVLGAPRTVTCPSCGADIEPPAADGIKSKVMDSALRTGVGSEQGAQQQAITVIVDTQSVRQADD